MFRVVGTFGMRQEYTLNMEHQSIVNHYTHTHSYLGAI